MLFVQYSFLDDAWKEKGFQLSGFIHGMWATKYSGHMACFNWAAVESISKSSEDHRSEIRNLCSYERKAWITVHAGWDWTLRSVIPVQCSNHNCYCPRTTRCERVTFWAKVRYLPLPIFSTNSIHSFFSGFSSRTCISCVFHCDGPLFIYFFIGWGYTNEIHIFIIYISKPIFLYTRSVLGWMLPSYSVN